MNLAVRVHIIFSCTVCQKKKNFITVKKIFAQMFAPITFLPYQFVFICWRSFS